MNLKHLENFMKEYKTVYKLSMENPHRHYLKVEVSFNKLPADKEFIDVKIPVWTPGSYMVREYAQHVHEFTANDFSDQNLNFEKINKNTWRIFKGLEESVQVSYLVYSFDLTVRTNFLNSSYAFVTPSATFVYLEEFKNEKALLKVELPEGWEKVSTGLKRIEGRTNTFQIENYDILVDSPLLCGNYQTFDFEVDGKNHEIAVQGIFKNDKNTFVSDIKKIVETEFELFGELPYKDYTFICIFSPGKYGGLEHLNSMAVVFDPFELVDEKRYKDWLALIAHEFFHLWNVKRIRPIELGPFDYDQEIYTKLLWVAEGITSYYDDFLVLKTGFYTTEEYLEVVSKNIKRLQTNYGRNICTLEESSFDAWIKFYRQNENSSNTICSYYNKGALLIMCLDLAIRNYSKNEKSFDDVLLRFNKFYKEEKRGFTKEEFKEMVKEVVGSDFPEILVNYLETTEEIDYEKYLGYAGVEFVKDEALPRNLGLDFSEKEGTLTVNRIYQGTPSWDSDINVNDEIIAIDGIRVNKTLLEKFLTKSESGQKFKFLIARDLEIREVELEATSLREENYKLVKKEDVSELAEQIFQKWIG
ncbi:MAG: M61 family peptidase [Calditrichaeota bacterium]|nr:MAG: M61 family peptidase [Calditrichota bacterium]